MEGGQLPETRYGPRAAVVDNIVYVTGGGLTSSSYFTSILSWDPSSESWQAAVDLGRNDHGAVTIPSYIIESECSAMP